MDTIRKSLCVLAVVAGFLGTASASHAAIIVVTNTSDFIGPQQTLFQRCINHVPAGQCTLRAAATLSSQLASADTIVLPATTYLLSLGELKFFGDVTLQGAGPLATIIKNAANKKNRILNFSAAGKATIRNLTVRGGFLESYVSPAWGPYQGGAGVRAVGVTELEIDNSRIIGNTISMKAGPWPIDLPHTDKSAASGIYAEGGLTLVNSSWVSSNTLVFAANEPGVAHRPSTIYVTSEKTQHQVDIRNSFIENNSAADNIDGDSSGSEIFLESGSVSIARSQFRNNDMPIIIVSSSDNMTTINESTFTTKNGRYSEMTVFPGTGLVTLTNNTFEESPLTLTQWEIEEGDAGSLRPNVVANNTFKLTNRVGQMAMTTNKAIAITHSGNRATAKAARPTLVIHNTISFRAPFIDQQLFQDMAAIYIGAPTTLQNNIIQAYPEPGFKHQLHPCYAYQLPWDEFPLTNLGGNLIVSPDVTPDSEEKLSCALNVNDIISADPLLGELQANGGWTPTMALMPGSPALSVALEPVGTTVPFDQRGENRPLGTGRDIGAFESDGGPVPNH